MKAMGRLGPTITVETTPEEFVFRSHHGEFRAHPTVHLADTDENPDALGVGASPPSGVASRSFYVLAPTSSPGRPRAAVLEAFLRFCFGRVQSPRVTVSPRVFFVNTRPIARVVLEPANVFREPAVRAGAREVFFDLKPDDLLI